MSAWCHISLMMLHCALFSFVKQNKSYMMQLVQFSVALLISVFSNICKISASSCYMP